MPKYLYKYRSLSGSETRSRTFDILTKGKIFYPRFDQLNDPFDGHVNFKKNVNLKELKELVEVLNIAFPEPKTELKYFLTPSGSIDRRKVNMLYTSLASSRLMFPNYGALCLSEIPSNILMWAHYSHFSGIAIELNTTGTVLENPGNLLQVTYKKSYPSIKITDFKPNEESAVRQIFSQKYIDWKYEKEWRAVTPYGGKVQDLPAQITSIILGPLIGDSDRVEITACAESKGIKLKRIIESKNKYELVLE